MSSLATRILDEIQKEMKVDQQWVSRGSTSLAWVAHKLEQTFSVSEPFTFMDQEAVSVESRIPVSVNVAWPAEQVCGLLSQFNYTNIGSAYVFDADRRQVYSSMKVVVREEDLGERCWQARIYAMFQLIMSEHQAAFIAEPVKGDVAQASSARDQPDAALDSFMDFITSRPRPENRFADPEEFRLAEEYVQKIGGVSTDAAPPEATLEFRFTDSSTSVASLLTGLEHPTVGRGLRSFLVLPISYQSNAEASLSANTLNLREVAANESGDFLGAWCIDQRSQNLSPVFSGYIPNSLYAKTLLAKTAVQLGMRAQACERWWFPQDRFSKTALEIVLARKGQVFEGDETSH